MWTWRPCQQQCNGSALICGQSVEKLFVEVRRRSCSLALIKRLMVREQKRMKHRLLTEEVERSEYQLFIWTHIWVFVCYLHNMVKGTGLVEWRRWRQWISHSKCSREQVFLSLCALAPPYGQRDKEVVRRSLGEEDTRARWILRRRCDGECKLWCTRYVSEASYNHS